MVGTRYMWDRMLASGLVLGSWFLFVEQRFFGVCVGLFQPGQRCFLCGPRFCLCVAGCVSRAPRFLSRGQVFCSRGPVFFREGHCFPPGGQGFLPWPLLFLS